jgi:serine/threonine protein kinase
MILISLLFQNNVLISDRGRAMLNGFEAVVVGELTEEGIETSQTPVGLARWMAPEMLEVDPFNPQLHRADAAVDVFAFGRMCLSVSAVLIVHRVSGGSMMLNV